MKQRLLFLGPPGAGKGTQAERICTACDLKHLSTGDLLRAEVAAETDLGKSAADLMNKGELVSDQIVLGIVENQLLNGVSGWILDGFPRTVNQAESLEALLNKLNQVIEGVILLELDDSVLLERLLMRGRPDDEESVIKNRLEVYRQKTQPLIEYYRKRGLVLEIQAIGSIDEITTRIEAALK